MGHLINPTGFRVGYFSNWADIWSVSNNYVYAEVLHNSLDYKRALTFYFENFMTDKYGILYSHFTVENAGLDKVLLKMYFYDGIVEQKIEHLLDSIKTFNRIRAKSHKYLMRRFRKIRTRFARVNFLNTWRYYDFMLAKRLVFFFIYLLNLANLNVDKESFERLWDCYLETFGKQWFECLRKRPTMSVYSFVKYYLKYLTLKGLNFEMRSAINAGKLPVVSDFSSFFSILKKVLNFWGRHHNFFRLLVYKRRVFYKYDYRRFLAFLDKVDRISLGFFAVFYRFYLMRFRQMTFFRFMAASITPVVNRIGLLETKLEFFGLDNNAVTASLLSRYLSRKLEMRFRIGELLTPIGRDLRLIMKNSLAIQGYKIQFVGRLTRRDRVRTSWSVSGNLPLSTISAQIEHAFTLGVLRNGVCCLRVWLYRHKSFGNYNFNYSYKLVNCF